MRFRFILVVAADLVFVPLVLFCLRFPSLVTYGLQMGKGELAIVWNARPVKAVFADPSVPSPVKIKLELIEEVRQFAFDSIGLKRTENYTTFFDQHGKPLIHVVTGCRPFALEPYLWHFPVLGDVPYKGFFDRAKAEKEERRLITKNYDADISGAGGWSTLGWFKDPVLSQMLHYSDGELAEVIIHELTHGTIFVKDSVEYNENLASFVGYKGALRFLELKFGKDSPQYREYIAGRKDDSTATGFMLRCTHRLDSLYKHFPPGCDSLRKAKLKQEMFSSFVNEAKCITFEGDTLFYERLEKKLKTSGNAVFMQYVRYSAKQDEFEKEFSRFKNLRDYMTWLKGKYGR